MSDDLTPTKPQLLDSLAEKVEAFRRDPRSSELYREVKEALRHANQGSELAEVAELHAQHLNDPRRAAGVLAEAGATRLRLGQAGEAERDLRDALALDPSSEQAAGRLSEHLIARGRFAEAAAVIEAELETLAEMAEQNGGELIPRRAERHRQVAALWDGKLARVDRALHHWQRAWQLEPLRTEALDAARAIYASLGKP
jgi:tetratricopeptide (TPR) repeat protein